MAQGEQNEKKRYKVRYMILSIVIAIVAWAVVVYTQDPDITKTISGIRIELEGTDTLQQAGFVVINEDELPKVSVKVRGKRSDLIRAMDNIKVKIDVSEITDAGEYSFDGAVYIPESRLEIIKTNARNIGIVTDKYTSRDVKLSIFQMGEMEGKVVKSVPESETVKFCGAESELELIDGAGVTIDVSQIAENPVQEAVVEYWCRDDIDPETLTTVTLEDRIDKVTNTIYDAKEVKVIPKVSNLPYVLDAVATVVNPQTVTVGIEDEKNIESVEALVTEYTESEIECKIQDVEGIYIPNESKTVKVKPAWLVLHD